MSADSISSVTSGAAQRATVAQQPMPAAPGKADKAGSSVPVLAPVLKAPESPKKAEIDFDPQQRRKELQDAIEHLNEQFKQNGRALEIGVDKTLNRPIYTVKNSQTGEVVRQIPDETLLRVAHHLEDIKGLMSDSRI